MPASKPEAQRICLISLGCAKNQVDSERFLGGLVESGAMICADPEDADIILINTCGFIDPAKEESIDTILEMAEYKETAQCRRLVVAGCLVARHAEELRAELPEVDAFVGVGDVDAVVEACAMTPGNGPVGRLRIGPRHVAYLRISDGCDNQCAYCTIPLIRGAFHSRPPGDVLAEASDLIADGAREIVLIGQDTTAYGRDLADVTLAGLLQEIAEQTGKAWLRLMYTHPAHFADELIDVFAEIGALCRYVDLPLQHLADPVLQRMGRKVTQKQILALVEKLRGAVPDLVFRTTYIVGFPGETERDFDELLNLADGLDFDHVGCFVYSREAGTPAHDMKDQIPEPLKQERCDRLMAAQYERVLKRNRSRIGNNVEILLDGLLDGGDVVGRTRGQAPDVDSVTRVVDCDAEPGQVLVAEIVDVDEYDLIARPVAADFSEE